MSSQRSVYVHQNSSGPSTASSSSRSSSSSANYAASNNSRSVSVRREYDAEGRSAEVVRTGGSVVINHRRRDYETDSPSPRYRGGYQ